MCIYVYIYIYMYRHAPVQVGEALDVQHVHLVDEQHA